MNVFIGMRSLIICGLVAGGLVLSLAGPASAQETRSVTIVDGRVTVNGKILAPDAVPDAIRSFEGRVSFTFDGEEEPILGFGDRLYRLERDRIVELSPEQIRTGLAGFAWPAPDAARIDSAISRVRVFVDDSLFVRPPFYPAPQVHLNRLPTFGFSMDPDSLRFDAEALREHAESMRAFAVNVRESMTVPPVQFYHRRAVGAPSSWDSFLNEMSIDRLQNARLHGHLQRERELDDESVQMAREISRTTSEDLRRELEADLRRHLEKIFETRQENRRAEIRELEDRLLQLRERLERREELRARIIEERMEFLLREEGATSRH